VLTFGVGGGCCDASRGCARKLWGPCCGCPQGVVLHVLRCRIWRHTSFSTAQRNGQVVPMGMATPALWPTYMNKYLQ
jgi:hypothetical protein